MCWDNPQVEDFSPLFDQLLALDDKCGGGEVEEDDILDLFNDENKEDDEDAMVLTLAPDASADSYKLPGAVGCFPSAQTFSASPGEVSCVGQSGQHGSRATRSVKLHRLAQSLVLWSTCRAN